MSLMMVYRKTTGRSPMDGDVWSILKAKDSQTPREHLRKLAEATSKAWLQPLCTSWTFSHTVDKDASGP